MKVVIYMEDIAELSRFFEIHVSLIVHHVITEIKRENDVLHVSFISYK